LFLGFARPCFPKKAMQAKPCEPPRLDQAVIGVDDVRVVPGPTEIADRVAPPHLIGADGRSAVLNQLER
jgi:hypothetical protein